MRPPGAISITLKRSMNTCIPMAPDAVTIIRRRRTAPIRIPMTRRKYAKSSIERMNEAIDRFIKY